MYELNRMLHCIPVQIFLVMYFWERKLKWELDVMLFKEFQ